MRDFPGFSSPRLPLAAVLLVSLAACTSGGGGNGDNSSSSSSGSSTAASCGSTVTLTGHVLAGAPVPGASVVIKDAKSVTRTTTASSTDGSYSVDIGCLSAPILVEASGIVAGRPVVLHSFLTGFSGSTPVLNVTPLTDAMLALVGGKDPVSYFADQDFTALNSTAASTDALSIALGKVLDQVIIAVGLTLPGDATKASPVNFFTDPITPSGRSGLDEVLELLNVVAMPLTTNNGLVTSEQVQIISRMDPTQRVQLTLSNGAIVAASSTLASGATVLMSANDLAGFAGNGLSGFGGIDALITTINGYIATSANGGANPSYKSDYLNDGSTSTAQGNSPSYQGAVIEQCTSTKPIPATSTTPLIPAKHYCRVRLGYSWSNTTHSVVSSDYYYDTVLNNGTSWLFYGNQQPYPVTVGYRYLQPVLPASGSTLTPQNPIEQLAVSIDTSPLQVGNNLAHGVVGVNISTVDSSNIPKALATAVTPDSNGLRSASSNPVTLVVPLTQAQATQLNAANGHVQIQIQVNNGSPVTQDYYLSWAMDPGAAGLPNGALATLPYPALLNSSLDRFLNWDTTSALGIDTTDLIAPVPAATPASVPVGDLAAVFGYNADLKQKNPPYVIAGELLPAAGSVLSNQEVFPSGTNISASGDRKVIIGTEDKDRNHYVSAYCSGTNAVANCK